MPIYAYRCDACGAEKDVLQKFSDAPLSVCPKCGAEAFRKVLTAPAFQLKGSGWYVTDFRDGNKAKPDAAKPAGAAGSDSGAAAGADGSGSGSDQAAAPGKAEAGGAGASAKTGETATGSSTPSTSGPSQGSAAS